MSTVTVSHVLAQAPATFMRVSDLPDGPTAPALGDTAEVRALVAAAQAGSQDAFGALVALHERVVFRTALAALGSREDAEDAAQDAFVMAWRRLDGFRGDASFKTWILTITWRKALDKRRARRLWFARRAGHWDGQPILDDLVATAPSPERAAVASDLAVRAQAAIARLSPKLRDALLLVVTGEYRYDEIASILGIPSGTLKWRVAEARRQLNLTLGDREAR